MVDFYGFLWIFLWFLWTIVHHKLMGLMDFMDHKTHSLWYTMVHKNRKKIRKWWIFMVFVDFLMVFMDHSAP